MTNDDLASSSTPLAHRVRPHKFEELIGAQNWRDGPLQAILSGAVPPNLILWGTPGCGKTTLALAIARSLGLQWEQRSAVEVGVKEVRNLIDLSRQGLEQSLLGKAQPMIIFLDEIHHFSRSQQDVVLRALEEGSIYLIGATTENPSFKLNAALLSRTLVVHVDRPSDEMMRDVIKRAWHAMKLPAEILDQRAEDKIILDASGDYRHALSVLERVIGMAQIGSGGPGGKEIGKITDELLAQAIVSGPLAYDRDGDAHYDAISALIKSMRGSDPDAALYWLAYMYEAGEDALYLARRILIFASEDIGNADPVALQTALSAYQAYERLGRDQGWIPLAQAVTYCATAPKSNAAYVGYKRAAKAVAAGAKHTDVPWHLRNKPTKILKELAATMGADPYQYPHDFPMGYAPNVSYLPPNISANKGESWYEPSDRGHEKLIRQRIEYLQGLDNKDRS